jgi:hypothetical protein
MRSRVVADRECPLDGLGKGGSSAYYTEILTVDHKWLQYMSLENAIHYNLQLCNDFEFL